MKYLPILLMAFLITFSTLFPVDIHAKETLPMETSQLDNLLAGIEN